MMNMMMDDDDDAVPFRRCSKGLMRSQLLCAATIGATHLKAKRARLGLSKRFLQPPLCRL